ncbi:MAG: DUF3488 and transglutaminase-like domain-containing protein [Actinomycetota bacterium]
MTATLESPDTGASPQPPPPAATPTAPAPAPQTQPIAAEVALTLVTLIAVAGLGRLFDDNSVLADLLLAGLAAHVLASASRRLGWGLLRSGLLQLVALVVVVSWVRYPDLQSWGLPSSATLDAARADLTEAWDAFGVVKAPTEPLPGFLLAGMVAIWLIGVVADAAAFRARLPVHALVGSFVLVLFTGMLGVDDWRLLSSVTYAAAALGFLLMYRLDRRPRRTAAARRRRSVQAGTGAAILGLAALLGAVGGPALPGAGDDPLFDWKELDGSGGGRRVTLSPLVDIRGRIVDQAPIEVFTVQADEAAYWRTTALDNFNGNVWGGEWKYEPVTGELDVLPPPVPQVTNIQTFTISGLADFWLPAAYLPVRIDQGAVKFDPESATLIGDGPTAEGFTYTVESVSPRFEADTLRRAEGPIPPEVLERYTALPDDFSAAARAEAERITADAATTYDAVRALQDYFIGNFTYDIDVAVGHDSGRVETFLTERRGYCEQFAGTMAAMARHLGIPARVAVGFTWGEPQEDGSYVVRGEHYHAWPEIWFPEIGWVPFEPTPGRGAPFSAAYTGVPEQQEGSNSLVPTTTIAGADDPTDAATPSVPDGLGLDGLEGEFTEDPGTTGAGGDGEGGGGSLATPIVAVVGATAAGGAAWALAVPALAAQRRRRRSRAASTDDERIEAAWTSLVSELTLDGMAPYEAETRREYVDRVAASTGLPGERLAAVADSADRAGFGGAAVSGGSTATIDEVQRLERQLRARHSTKDRVRRRLDPRPLQPSWPRRKPGSPPVVD